MKNVLGLVLLMGLMSISAFANEQYSLERAKEQVVNENIKVSIAYEQYVLVKSQAQSKTLQLLPSLSIDMLIYDYQYAILRTLIPEPQRFFEAAAAKDMAAAANVNRRIVQKNLLEDLEKTFYLFQYHQDLISSIAKENEIVNEIATRSQEAYDLGAINFNEYYTAQRNVVAAKTQKVNATEILKTEEFALKLILQVDNNQEGLALERLSFTNENLNFPMSVDEAVSVAVNNSKEIEQFDHLIAAANKQKKGVAVSWISWNGVGFDYFSRVSIAKSEIKKLELMKKKAVYEIKNQVAAQYASIESHKEKMSFQAQLLDMAREEYVQAKASETELLNSFINTKKAELSLMQAEREALRLKYELELKYIKLKRLIGANMMTNEIPR